MEKRNEVSLQKDKTSVFFLISLIRYPRFLVCQFRGRCDALIIQWSPHRIPETLSTCITADSGSIIRLSLIYSLLSGRALRPPFKLFIRLRNPPPLEGFSPSLLPGRGALSAVTLLVRPLPCPAGIAELADKFLVAEGRSCSAMRICAPLRA
jgi:hypothetical protein